MTAIQHAVQKTDRYTTPSQVLFRYLGNIATVVVAASPACHAEAKTYVAAQVDARAAEAKEAKAAKLEAANKQKAARKERQKRLAALRLGAIIAHA